MPLSNINGLRHYFRLEGSSAGTPVVLVHAIGTDLALWDRVVPSLTRSCQILRYDIRGHGGTDAPHADCTIAELAADLLALTESIGWQRFSICGLSIGALIAVEAALAAPEKVKNLVLTSAAAQIAPPPGGWGQRARLAREHGMQPLAAPMIERMFSLRYRESGEAMLHTMHSVFVHTDPRGYAACVAALEAADLTSRVGSIGCPTLVVRGTQDLLLPRAAAESLAEGIEDAKLTEVMAAHFPPLEDPEGFVGQVEPLLTARPI